MMNDALRNMKFFMERLKNLPSSESLTLGDSGGFCVSTRTEEENWIYFPERVNDSETVRKAAEFFRERNETALWPVFDGGNEILTEGGMFHDRQLRAMSLDSGCSVSIRGNESVTFKAVTTREDSLRWAKSAWLGFDYGGDEPSEDYCEFAGNLTGCRDFVVCVSVLNGRDAGTFIAVNDDAGLTGVYYFAVIPEMRRKGVAVSMMNEIRRLSQGKKIVLQATESGVPFYSAYGFKDLGGIDVYSTSEQR